MRTNRRNTEVMGNHKRLHNHRTEKRLDGRERIKRRAHSVCVHQTLAPGTPSSPGMPTSPYRQHNIHREVALSAQLCELLVSGQNSLNV